LTLIGYPGEFDGVGKYGECPAFPRTVGQKGNDMKLKVLVASCLILMLPLFSQAYDQLDIEKDSATLKAIITDLYQTQIKHLKEEPEISVYRYADGETDKLLSSLEYEVVHRCREKYEVRVVAKAIQSLYIYCFEDKKAKMLLEKKSHRNNH
jgi:hypothetical protein